MKRKYPVWKYIAFLVAAFSFGCVVFSDRKTETPHEEEVVCGASEDILLNLKQDENYLIINAQEEYIISILYPYNIGNIT